MQMPDVNVLIYAHREDAPEHERYVAWLQALTASDEPFALSDVVLSGFLRIVTNQLDRVQRHPDHAFRIGNQGVDCDIDVDISGFHSVLAQQHPGIEIEWPPRSGR